MATQPAKDRDVKWDHTPPRLAFSKGASMPPSPPALSMAQTPPRGPTLTETFNRAADPRVQITLLRKKQSRPAATLDYGVRGSVVRSINPKRDRQIQKTIESLSRTLAKSQKQPQQLEFDLKTKNQITPLFNMSVKRR